VQRRRSELTRLFAGVVIAAAAAFAMSGCSPGADYPSIFPAIHDMPPPRADTPLDQVQVQQATEDLITERNHLTAEAQGPGQKAAADPAAVGTNPPAAKKKALADSAAQGAAAGGTLTAGTETK
jgi:hypothetical protein